MGELELVQTLKPSDSGRIWNLAWHPKGDLLASCGEDKSIRIWTKDITGKWTNKVVLTDGHKRTIRQVAWSPCGKLLASASFDATVCIWDKKSGSFECNATLEGHENEVKSVAWSQTGTDDQYLATCSRDKSVWLWEVHDEDYDCAAVLNAHTQDVKRIVFNPKKFLLASASYDNTIKLFGDDIGDGEIVCHQVLKGHESTVWSISFDAKGERLASCSDDKTVKIWKEYAVDNPPEGVINNEYSNNFTWKCICTLSGHHGRTVYDINWCHLTGLIATACGDDAIRIFKEDENSDPDAPTFSCVVHVAKAHTQDVNCVAWNPVISGLLASCSDDGEIKIWQYKDNN